MHYVNGSLYPWICHEKIDGGIHSQIQIARRKVASTKQFIKLKDTLKVGEQTVF